MCAYIYEIANEFNKFYHETKILSEEDEEKRSGYIALLGLTKRVLETCIDLLGFEAPEGCNGKMTEKLFYKDSHLSKFDAEVLSCVRAKRQQVKDSFGRLDGKAGEYYEIELDRTAFFPEGGGQYADTGVLYMADDDTCGLDETARKKVQVLDVRERNGRIFHITDGFIEAKTAVKGSIDWEERFMKMQQHTGEHIVSG